MPPRGSKRGREVAPAAPLGPAEAPPEDPVRKAVAAILNVPKQRSALPTLVTYPTGESVLQRYVIIDVSEEVLRQAWAAYQGLVPNAVPERFLCLVYNITGCEVPRMYRAVGTVYLGPAPRDLRE